MQKVIVDWIPFAKYYRMLGISIIRSDLTSYMGWINFSKGFSVESHHLMLVVVENRIFRDYKLTRKMQQFGEQNGELVDETSNKLKSSLWIIFP